MTTDTYTQWGAAYVLGALSPSERTEFERHLAGCAACATEVATLKELPAAMSALPAESATELITGDDGPPHSLLPRLLEAARAEQHQSRWRAGVAIGAAVAAAAILVLAVVWRVSADDERTMAMLQTVPSAVTAEVTLIGERSGTRIEVACVYGEDPAGATRQFGLFVTDTEGSEALLASWTAEPGSHSWPEATTGLAEQDIGLIDIRALNTGEVLLEVEP